MAKPAKRRVEGGGRVTPKGTLKKAAPQASQGRYTPPIPREYKVSPWWVPALMFTLLGLGVLMIILNYVNVLPGGTSNWYLGGGLLAILLGIIVATQYH
jgi:hypothetical protein